MLSKLQKQPDSLRMASCRELADKCLSCGRCEGVCPQGLSVPSVLAKLRATHPGWQQWVWQRWIEKGAALWPLLSGFSRLLPENRPHDLPRQAHRAHRTHRAYGADFPITDTLKSLLASAQSMRPDSDSSTPVPTLLRVVRYDTSVGASRSIMLFSGCTARRVQKQWKHKAVALLHGLGFTVLDESELTCCGITLDHAGLPEAAARSRMINIAAWRKAGRPLITTFCATCLHGLQGYGVEKTAQGDIPDAISWEEGEQEIWRNSLVPLSSLLLSSEVQAIDLNTEPVESIEKSEPAGAALDAVHYHEPCHWNGHDADKRWLQSLFAHRLITPDGPLCCGMGGVLQLADRQLSRHVSARCWQAHSPTAENAPALLVSGCSGCILQLKSTAPQGALVTHWLDVIDPAPDTTTV